MAASLLAWPAISAAGENGVRDANPPRETKAARPHFPFSIVSPAGFAEPTATKAKTTQPDRKGSETRAAATAKKSPAPVKIIRIRESADQEPADERSADNESANQGVPTPARSLKSDGSEAKEETPQRVERPARSRKIDDANEETPDDDTASSAKSYKIEDASEVDELKVSVKTVRIEDDEEPSEGDNVAVARKREPSVVERLSDDPATYTAGESIAALVEFNPAKPAVAGPRVRPAFIRHVQPNELRPLENAGETAQPRSSITAVGQEPLPANNAPAPGDAPAELPEEIRAEFKSIASLGTKIRADGDKYPADRAQSRFKHEGELYHALGYRRPWAESQYVWTAPGLAYYPLYFEDVNLERHGHSFGLVQPAVSALNFYGRLPFLPYMMAVNRPLELQYTLGHIRPGSYAPFQLHYPPIKARGFVVEAAAVAAIFLIFP